MKNIKFKLNIINKILTPIVTIISNIKYLFCVNMSDFKASQELWNMASTNQYSNLYNRVDKIYDNIDIENIEDKMYDMSNSIDDIQNDLEDKPSEYQIQDIIHDTFGYSEDYVNYDDMNDVKDDIKSINETIYELEKETSLISKHLKTDMDNIHIDLFYDRYHNEIVCKVIEEIVFRVQPNPRVSLDYNNDNV